MIRRFLLGPALALIGLCAPACAQFAKNPFSIGIDEGAVGEVGRVGLWLLARQAEFYQAMTHALIFARENPSGAFWLAAVSFLYGVFHAAGPGHGKAVIASYMLASEKILLRGVVLSGLAAALQALVAVALVGFFALALHATALKMAGAAHVVEWAAFVAIAGFGAALSLRKGLALARFFRAPALKSSSRFVCVADGADHAENCPHCVAPDPQKLGENFSWRRDAATIVVAGARPCSGALLVLIFAASQNMFWTGIWAVAAMAVGTGLTTAALAAGAVLAKSFFTRILGPTSRRAEIFGRGVELAAALAVLGLGLALLLGYALVNG